MVVVIVGKSMMTSEDDKFKLREGLALSRMVVAIPLEWVVSKSDRFILRKMGPRAFFYSS